MTTATPAHPVSPADELAALTLPSSLNRLHNAAWRNGVRTVGQLVEHSEVDVLCWRGVGQVTLDELVAVLAAHGLSLATTRRKRSPAAPSVPIVAAGAPAPLSSPPGPGLARARWLGERITATAGAEDRSLAPHAKRRAAARRALAEVTGHSAADADNDALYFASASLHLAGLNEYARRVLDEGELPAADDDEEAGHAVL